MKNIPSVRLALLSLCVAMPVAVHAEDGPTAAGTIVFSQDFSSNMNGFERSPANLPVDRIQLAPDPIGQRGQVLRVIWLAGDNYRTSSGTMPRSWASSAPGYQYGLGTTVNYAFGYMTTSTNIDANLAQNIRPGGPLWEMQGDTAGNLFIVANGHTSWTSLGVKAVANRWYDIRVETKYVTGTGGHITVWIDGVQCFSKTGIGWNDPAGTLARFDCGIYNRSGPVKSDLTKSRTVYISNLSVGTLNGVSAASAPVFSPSGGTYTSAQTVTVTSATSGVSIRYTTDGSTPSETAGTLYSGPVNISRSATLKAIAYKTGLSDSTVTSAAYTINIPPPQVAAPTFSPAGGTFVSPPAITISTTTAGASIRYTTDGSTPSETAGTVYSGPVTVSTTTTLKALAYEAGFTDSTVSSATYTFTPPPPLNFEAESLSPVGTGATVSISNDANASGGVVEFLNSTAAGQIMTFTTPVIPAGTYQVQLRYWGNVTRGQHTVKIDGTQLGGTIDQYATAKTYVTVTLGTVTFASTGAHSIAMTVTGKRSAATQFYLTADKFTFVGQ